MSLPNRRSDGLHHDELFLLVDAEHRYRNGEGRALSRRRLYRDFARVIPDDPEADGEPQAGTLARRLGAEEGLEDPLLDLLGDPGAGVADGGAVSGHIL